MQTYAKTVMHYVCIIICVLFFDEFFVCVNTLDNEAPSDSDSVLRSFSVMSEFDFSSSVSYDISEFILIFCFCCLINISDYYLS